MKYTALLLRSAVICLLFLFMASYSFAADTLYTAYNIWYETGKEAGLWCINYKTGNMIPAGTQVRDARLTRAVIGRGIGPRPPAITFVTVNDGKRYYVNFKKRYHPGKTIQEYMAAMFTQKDFFALTQGLGDREIAAIRKGAIVLGMSKQAVIASFGYPPEHHTPSLNDNVWTYWMNRFSSKKFHFDARGETVYPVTMARR